MRSVIPYNYDWQFTPAFQDSFLQNPQEAKWEAVDLPHTNTELPYNYFSEQAYQFVSCYQKQIFAPLDWSDKCICLFFEAAMAYAEVYCNGRLVASHKGGYTAFTADISDFLSFGTENTILVKVDSTERPDFAPCGYVVDYLTYGGIYREVTLLVLEKTHIQRLHVSPCKETDGTEYLTVDALLSKACPNGALILSLSAKSAPREIIHTSRIPLGDAGNAIRTRIDCSLTHWSPEHPMLYTISAQLRCGDGSPTDELCVSFGNRFCEFRPDGFYLNGEPLKIVGLNRHQAYPYVGYAMPQRVQEKDAEILKKELGVNLVRTSHYPQSHHFLDRCDALGLLVFEEIPGWQHIGDKGWQEVSIHNVREMIEQDYNHPSIILWGVRINESEDNHDFYAQTNALAHQLDKTRQTGGVRCNQNSELLEDVYTFNDFVHSGGTEILRKREAVTGLDRPVPLLVTENNGHMFPTKRFDSEQKLVEHTKRHLRVVNEALGRDDITGTIGWCAFDYNTHGCFGSGDKICYHGVSDMFRIPKYAGHGYSSQRPAEGAPFLELLSVFSHGENSGGGMVPLMVATNCDFVRVYKNGKLVDDFFPDKSTYPNLPHPPVMISHLLPREIDFNVDSVYIQALKDYIVKKTAGGALSEISSEDYLFLGGLAQESGLSSEQMMSLALALTGGWGDAENTICLEGIVNGQVVIRKDVSEGKSFGSIEIAADDNALQVGGDTYDATRIVLKALDNEGNLMPFYPGVVQVETDNQLSVMGPKEFALIGGCIAFWVRTTGEAGESKISVRVNGKPLEVIIQVTK